MDLIGGGRTVGALIEFLTAPGAVEQLRWQWLIDSPEGPATGAAVPPLAGAYPPVVALTATIDTSYLEVLGQVQLRARVPVPPGWPGGGELRPLGGLALITVAGELLGVVWVTPPVRHYVRAVDVVFTAYRGTPGADS